MINVLLTAFSSLKVCVRDPATHLLARKVEDTVCRRGVGEHHHIPATQMESEMMIRSGRKDPVCTCISSEAVASGRDVTVSETQM